MAVALSCQSAMSAEYEAPHSSLLNVFGRASSTCQRLYRKLIHLLANLSSLSASSTHIHCGGLAPSAKLLAAVAGVPNNRLCSLVTGYPVAKLHLRSKWNARRRKHACVDSILSSEMVPSNTGSSDNPNTEPSFLQVSTNFRLVEPPTNNQCC